jgi:hypothetical protein
MVLFSAAAFSQMPGGGMGGGSGSFMGFENHNVNHDLIIPQIAVGQHYVTNLLLLNIGNSQAMTWVTPQNLVTTGKVYFYRQDGTRLLVSINGGTPASEFAFSLDPSKSVYCTVSSKDSDTSGWALVDVDEPATGSGWGMMDGQTMTRGMRLMANVFYTYSGSGQPTSRVGVVPSMYEMGRFATSIISAQSRDDLYTGVAIVNTGANSATVTLRLKDSNGSVLATTPLDIKSGNQTAKFLNELFSTKIPTDFQGVLEVSSGDDGIVTMGLLVSQGIMTSVPMMLYGQVSMMP